MPSLSPCGILRKICGDASHTHTPKYGDTNKGGLQHRSHKNVCSRNSRLIRLVDHHAATHSNGAEHKVDDSAVHKPAPLRSHSSLVSYGKLLSPHTPNDEAQSAAAAVCNSGPLHHCPLKTSSTTPVLFFIPSLLPALPTAPIRPNYTATENISNNAQQSAMSTLDGHSCANISQACNSTLHLTPLPHILYIALPLLNEIQDPPEKQKKRRGEMPQLQPSIAATTYKNSAQCTAL